MHTQHFAIFFITLFSIVNPIGCLPIFVEATGNDPPRVRNGIALLMGLFIFLGLGTFYLAGNEVLRFFDVSLPAFRIAGGIILLLTGIKMLWEVHSDAAHPKAPAARKSAMRMAASRFQTIFIPLVFPIFVGPGSVATAIILSSQYPSTIPTRIAGTSAIFAVAGVTVLILLMSSAIKRVLGGLGMEICSRLLGLILVAMAVQFILVGFSEVTDGLIHIKQADEAITLNE
ncbi:inner membrane protein [Poriferisphaera corsica]|uniref:UPF0056 membrane protein n=1 Tax=Poriferisphaera corsica TaxID=2528020 RepID=A0A517YQL5_9BACT|nr:MarC family protein [Poriferisphaera corsica]QDU32491.1 inner membrane protein [Poriferisphaera corsica]